MNRCRRLARLACCVTASVLAAASVVQAAAISALPLAERTTDQPKRDLVVGFITKAAALLAGTDAQARGDARDALVGSVASAGNQAPSAAYLDLFASTLDAAMQPLTSNADVNVRLNVAIVAARVAYRADNGRLEGTTIKLLSDKSPAVVLWAIKSAGGVLPWVVQRPGNPLLPAVVAQANGANVSGAVIAEIYQALTCHANEGGHAVPPNVYASVVPSIHKLMRARLAGYSGAATPAEPKAESIAFTMLVSKAVWTTQKPDQQVATIELILDTMAAAANASASGAQGVDVLRVGVVKSAAQSILSTVSYQLGVSGPAKEAAERALKAVSDNAGGGAPLPPLVQAVGPALQALPPLKALKVPTTMATTAPATAPAK